MTGSNNWEAPDGSLIYVSPSAERITGYRASDFIENPELISEIIIPEDRQIWDSLKSAKDINRSLLQGIQFRIYKKDGDVRWIEHARQPVNDPQGEFLGVRASNRDITARKKAENELQRKDSMLEEAQKIAHLGSWNWNIITNDLEWSHELYQIFDILPQEFGATYETFLERIHPEDIENVKEAVKSAIADPDTNYNIMHRIITPDGNERIVRERGNVTFDDQGNASHMIGTTQDVTDIRKIELEAERLMAELSHVGRVSTMGALTAGIAHEINQPLAGILSNAQAALRFIKNDSQDFEEVEAALYDIVSDCKRSGEMVHSIRNMVGRYDSKLEEIELNGTIRDVLTLVRSETLERNILLSESLQSDIPTVNADRIQIQQLALNLVMNAIEAIEENHTQTGEVIVSTRINDDNEVMICVSDSGPGIEPDRLKTVFDSFETTKKRGMGMGLSICRSIADRHGGRLWAENRLEGGAIFFFALPTRTKSDE